MPASYAAAAWWTSSRAACRRVATSASRCETAWKSAAACRTRGARRRASRAAASAACAIPTANGADAGAEEVERAHRDPEAAVDLAHDVLGRDVDVLEHEPADRVRRDELDGLAG